MLRCLTGRLAPRALAVALIAAVGALPVVAGPTGVLGGRVLGAEGGPSAAVTVHLVDDHGASPAVIASTTTGDDGRFTIRDAAAGNYRLLVDTPEGAFLAPGRVTVDTGTNRPLALTLGAAKLDHGFGSPEASGLPTWGTWLIAGAIGVAALFVISEVSDDEPPASAF